MTVSRDGESSVRRMSRQLRPDRDQVGTEHTLATAFPRGGVGASPAVENKQASPVVKSDRGHPWRGQGMAPNGAPPVSSRQALAGIVL